MMELTEQEIKDIRKNSNNYNWFNISSDYNLSEDFIIEFKTRVSWYYVSIYQKLSENFIIEFQDNVDWYWISYYQELSDEFIRKNISKLYKDYLLRNPVISEKIKQIISLLSNENLL